MVQKHALALECTISHMITTKLQDLMNPHISQLRLVILSDIKWSEVIWMPSLGGEISSA